MAVGGEGDVWFGAGLRKVDEMHQGNDLYSSPSLVLLGHRPKAALGAHGNNPCSNKSPHRSLDDDLSPGMRDQDCPETLHTAVQLHSPLGLCSSSLQLRGC